MSPPPPPPPPTRAGGPRAAVVPRIRQMRLEDVEAILEMGRLAFADIPGERHWKPEQVEAHVRVFPEGQFVAEADGRIVGSCMNMLTSYSTAMRPHTWREITGRGSLKPHAPTGSVLYGTEVMVHPHARRMGIGRRLFNARFQFVRDNELRAFVTGGRLPGYAEKAEELTPWEYIQAVVRGDFTDPVLTPELRWGLEPRGVLCGYMHDPPSLHHATLAVWENPELEVD